VTGSPIVIDASIALRWLLPDPLSEACWKLYARTAEAGDQITVPTLWVYEVVSGLTKAVYFGSLSPDEARKGLIQIFALGAQPADPTESFSSRALEWTLRLNRAAAYDSFYLSLAEALGCHMWTADRRLYNSAREIRLEWVHWVEEA